MNTSESQKLESEIDGLRKSNPEIDQVEILSTDICGHFFGKRYPIDKLFAKLADMNYDGWIIYEYPKHWCPELADDAERVLREGAELMYSWIAQPAGA